MQLRSGKRVNEGRSGKRVTEGPGFFFPDEIVTKILMRLPAEDVVRCRRVCRKWRDITSAQYFLDKHSRSHPVILATCLMNLRFDQVLFSNWWEPRPSGSIVRRLNKYSERFRGSFHSCSGDGLIVLRSDFSSSRDFVVFSLVYGEQVTVVFPRNLFDRIEAFAIYFHPTLQQYCILWAIDGKQVHGPRVQYMILSLGPNPCWREIRNNEVKNSDNTKLLLGRYVYWLVKKPAEAGNDEYSGKYAIMEFDILSEELKVMPSPVSSDVKFNGYRKDLLDNKNISLLDVDGLLSLFIISPQQSESQVYQWTLISREDELWTSSICNVREGNGYLKSPFHYQSPVRAIAFMDGRVLIDSPRIVVLLDLKLGTVRKLGWEHSAFSRLLLHRINFASVKNCKSKIIIEELQLQNKYLGNE